MIASIQDVVRSKLCISCGICCGVCSPGAVKMKERSSQGMILPEALNSNVAFGKGPEFDLCPGKGYPLVQLSREFFPDAPHSDIGLGVWHHVCAARTTDPRLSEQASSGGIMTGIVAWLLETGRVQGAVVTRMSYGPPGPRPQTYIARSAEEILPSQGSKYCPVPALEILPQMGAFDGTLVFIGTPCQIGALRLLQQKYPEFREKVPLVIGNFCGGFRDLRETDTLIRRSGIRPEEVVRFRYRGGGQPGSMRIEDRNGTIVDLPYPAYVRRTGYVKHKRCRLCVDATAELADFSCGDAWIPRFMESGKPWSLVMTRSRQAQTILDEMVGLGKAEVDRVSLEEIKDSQYLNLLSKKVRQDARRRFQRLIGSALPAFDGGWPKTRGGLALEVKAEIRHDLLYLLEKLRLYSWIAKLLRRC